MFIMPSPSVAPITRHDRHYVENPDTDGAWPGRRFQVASSAGGPEFSRRMKVVAANVSPLLRPAGELRVRESRIKEGTARCVRKRS